MSSWEHYPPRKSKARDGWTEPIFNNPKPVSERKNPMNMFLSGAATAYFLGQIVKLFWPELMPSHIEYIPGGLVLFFTAANYWWNKK